MKVHHDEGVATHIGLKPCSALREAGAEASVEERAGQPLSRESFPSREPTVYPYRKATRAGAPSQAPKRPGVVEDTGMHIRSLHGNREVCGLVLARVLSKARIGKVRNHSR